MRLKDQVAIVTGGSQGIGEAIARRYAAEGVKVAIVNRKEDRAATVVTSIRAAGGEATAFAADISRVAEIDRMVAAVLDTYGTIDILVNNAGAYYLSPLGSTVEAEFDAMLDTNIKGVFFLSQAVLPEFERRGRGKIINIGSIFGNDGFPGSAAYCATKGAIVLLTKSLGLELRERNIQVNAIAPGYIETPLNAGYRATNKEWLRRADERFGGPGVWMKPDELSGAAVFLASADADSVTGTVLFVTAAGRLTERGSETQCASRRTSAAPSRISSSRTTTEGSPCSRRRRCRASRSRACSPLSTSRPASSA
jgi:NAD(P)-dependent dehydrogenase (short-subunit alcohol dehydrogenase family)